ncbi:MAG: lipid II flippase MurJ [Candidatus Hodarchaeota archaeon]
MRVSKHIKTIVRSKLSRDIVLTTVINSISKGTGLLVPFAVALFYGASELTDAFFFTYSFIMFFTMILSTTLESVLVPFFVEKKSIPSQLNAFLEKIFGLTIISFMIVAVSIFLLIGPITILLTKFSSPTISLIQVLAVESIPIVLFMIVASIFVANLNAHTVFHISAISPAVRALGVTGLIVACHSMLGIHAIPLAYCIGTFLCCVFLWNSSKRYMVVVRFLPRFRWGKKFREFVKIASFQMFGLVAVGFNPFIDRTMATWLGVGNISVLVYAEKIYFMPVLLLTGGLFTVILPRWAASSANNDHRTLREEVKLLLLVSLATSFIAVTPVLIFLENIVGVLFGAGIDDSSILQLIRETAVFYLLGVGPYIMGQIVVRALLAMKLTRSIMVISVAKSIFNVLLNLTFMWWLGVAGIALSTTVNAVIIFFVLYLTLIYQTKTYEDYGTVSGNIVQRDILNDYR